MNSENTEPPKKNMFTRVATFWKSRSLWEQIAAGLIVATIIALYSVYSACASRRAPLDISVECDLPEDLKPGDAIDVVYEITASADIKVGIGGGLYDEATDDHASGTGDLDSYAIKSGRSNVVRRFVIPDDLPTGVYEMVAEVWPANRIGHEDEDVLAEGTCGFVNVP
jgi:hypothetical protein